MQALQGAGKTVHGYIPGEQPNARGAEAMGMVPRRRGSIRATMLEAARDGTVRVVCDLRRQPDAALSRLRAAGGRIEKRGEDKPFVVVSELFFTRDRSAASLVLPARGAFEKDGTFTNVTGERRRRRWPALRPPEARWSDGEMLVALADALGAALPAAGGHHRRRCANSRATRTCRPSAT